MRVFLSVLSLILFTNFSFGQVTLSGIPVQAEYFPQDQLNLTLTAALQPHTGTLFITTYCEYQEPIPGGRWVKAASSSFQFIGIDANAAYQFIVPNVPLGMPRVQARMYAQVLFIRDGQLLYANSNYIPFVVNRR